MAFKVSSRVAGDVVSMTLVGELDAASAGVFKSEIDKAVGQSPRSLVLELKDLTFMASAGLRVLIYAKQKLGSSVSLYAVAPQEGIVTTLRMTGFDKSVYIVDQAPPLTPDAGGRA
jgi:anti-anti-sigma factor